MKRKTENLIWNEIFKKFGVTESEVQDALLINDRHEQLVIAYHLIIDNKRIWNEGFFFKNLLFVLVSKIFYFLARKVEIADFFVASSPPHSAFLSITVNETISRLMY